MTISKNIFLIAEIGINHNGDISLAKKLINEASKAGFDAVKFQKRTIEKVYSKEFLPEKIMNQFSDKTSETTPDGRRWLKPTPVYMKPGDATIAMYHIPHSGSRNENGKSARKSPIFALVNKKTPKP